MAGWGGACVGFLDKLRDPVDGGAGEVRLLKHFEARVNMSESQMLGIELLYTVGDLVCLDFTVAMLWFSIRIRMYITWFLFYRSLQLRDFEFSMRTWTSNWLKSFKDCKTFKVVLPFIL